MESKLNIPLHGNSVNIVKQSSHALNDILFSKFRCTATVDGVDFESSSSTAQQQGPNLVPEKRFSVILRSGVEVSVWKADLTDFRVDAVVNAANENLSHAGGLAYALCAAGGPQIQRESDDYIKKNGFLKTGLAIVTSPGLLKCKKLIHAVGPYLSQPSDLKQAEPLLEKTIRSILDIVKETRLDRVAIPAISSGIFNYPLYQCANTIVTTVKNYYDKNANQRHLPKEICLVNNDEPTVSEMNRAAHQILAPHMPLATTSQVSTRQTRGADQASTPSVQIQNVLLVLKRDHIEEQKTDVIVNTTSQSLNLSEGAISSALLSKAGKGMQNEIKQAPKKGNIIATKSYNLSCKEVYHTFCPAKRKFPDQTAARMLFESVLECLQLAAQRNHRSIAFPAIGTGVLGFSKSESATIMSDAVVNFAQNFHKKMEVHFVIFPADNAIFQAFEAHMSSLRQKSGFTAGHKNKDGFQGTSSLTPQITLMGPSDESVHEAEHWLSHLLFKFTGGIYIHNNFIQHLGEKEHAQLSGLNRNGVTIEEFLSNGHACILIDGESVVDVALAALQVEAMLCKIQEDFLFEEKSELELRSTNKVSFERKTFHLSTPEFKYKMRAFSKEGLWVLKVESVENSTLRELFDLKKKQLHCSSTQKIFQQIPAQFCDMVSQIGFRAEFAPPENPEYGEGIYFAGTVKKAMQVWKGKNNDYLYFVEAEVLTGNSTRGSPDLILPPAVKNSQKMYDSVDGGSDISVIFSGYQAMPKYIITCKKV